MPHQLIDCCVAFIDFIVAPLPFVVPLLLSPPPQLIDCCVLFYQHYCHPADVRCAAVVAVVVVPTAAINCLLCSFY